MNASERTVSGVARAILDGTPVDWPAVESTADETERPLLERLRLLARLVDFHREQRASDEPAPRAKTWGHLHVLEPIGSGAFGRVHRAWDTRLDREVALKLLPTGPPSADSAASAIIHEGRLLARVRHPNVVTIYGAEQIADQIGLWMEFVRGRTLEHVVAQQKVVSAADVVDVGLELCRAVSAVHGAGLLHRDIKTHNVMRAEDGRIVLMDFGTGRELDDDTSSDLAGTPLYLAPEVLRGQQATVRSDIYSLGVLLYHLVTGSYPVHGRTVREVRRAHERGEQTPVQTARRDVPPKLARIIERAIDPRPERRYESADALSGDLAALKPRPRIVRLTYAAGVAAAFILVAGVGWEVAGRQVGSSRTPSALLAGFAGLGPVGVVNVSPIERPIIAVLPLKNLSTEPDSDYFVDGLTDEIIRNLAVIEGLEVRSRTSSFAFKDKPRNLHEIGAQLGANLVIEGSVLRAGNRLRINAQLVQVAGDIPLWADRFDRELKDVFAIQDEISRAIVNKLRLTLGRGQRRYDTDLDTYDLYLKARTLIGRRGVANAEQAADLFQRVVARDPGFAPAHAGLALAYAFMSMPYVGIHFEAAYSIMRPAAVNALQLDPLLAEAHAAMGWVYAYERHWANAEKAFQRAIELNPSLTHLYTSYSISTLEPLGKPDEALRLLQVASRHDPLSLDVQREIGRMQVASGRYGEAIDTFRRVHAADPEFPFVREGLARALMGAGRVAEAFPLDPRSPWLAHAYVRAGRRAQAEELVAAHEGDPWGLAIIYAALGDRDRAFEALQRVAASGPQRLGRLLNAPEMAVLRDDPRLAVLRRKLGLP